MRHILRCALLRSQTNTMDRITDDPEEDPDVDLAAEDGGRLSQSRHLNVKEIPELNHRNQNTSSLNRF